MTAIPNGSPVFIDFAGGSSISQSVTVPAGTTAVSVYFGLCPAGTIASRTVSACTFNGVTLTQVASSRVTSTDGNFVSSEWWRKTSPATGAHTFAVTLSGAARGGVWICFDIGDTGVGQVNAAQDSVVALNGSSVPLDSSMIRFGCVFLPSGTPSLVPTQAAPFQIGFNKGASAVTRAVTTSYMRGYPDHPAVSNDGSAGRGVTCSAIEILS